MDGMDPTSGFPRPGGLQDLNVGGPVDNQAPTDPRIVPTSKHIPQGAGIPFDQPALAARSSVPQPGRLYVGQGAEIASQLEQNQQMLTHSHLMANTLNAQQQLVKAMPVIQNFGNIFMGPANNAGNMGPAAGQNFGFNVGYNGPLHPTGPVNVFPMVSNCPRPVLQQFLPPMAGLPQGFGNAALPLITQQLSIACGVMLQCMQNISALTAELSRYGMATPAQGFQMGQMPMALPFNQVVNNLQWMSNLGQAGMGAMPSMPPVPPMYCYPQAMPMAAPAGVPFANFSLQPTAPIAMAPNVLHGMCPNFNQMPLQQMPGWPLFAAGFGAFVPPGGFGPMPGIFQGPQVLGPLPWQTGRAVPTAGQQPGAAQPAGPHKPGKTPSPAEPGVSGEPSVKITRAEFENYIKVGSHLCEKGDLEGLDNFIEKLKPIKAGPYILELLLVETLSRGKQSEVVEKLLNNGVDPNKKVNEKTYLEYAFASKGDESPACVAVLLNHGAKLDQATPIALLHCADQSGQDEKVRYLLSKFDKDTLKAQLEKADKTAGDFKHPAIKALFGVQTNTIPEEAQAAYDNFLNSCKADGPLDQVKSSYTTLKDAWPEFDLNEQYEDQGTPLENVIEGGMTPEGKVNAIRFLRSKGAEYKQDTHNSLLADMPEHEQLLFRAALTVPDVKSYKGRVEKTVVPYTPDVHHLEGAEKKRQQDNWKKREHRASSVSPDKLDEHFKTKREAIATLQKEAQSKHPERAKAFIKASAETETTPLQPKIKTKIGELTCGVAAFADTGKTLDVNKLYLRDTFTVKGQAFHLTGLCDPKGPNGEAIAKFVKDEYPKALEKRLATKEISDSHVLDAQKLAMVDVNNTLAGHKTLGKYKESGVAASFVMTTKDKPDSDSTKIWTANIGDAQTLLVNSDGTVEQLTKATPSHRIAGFSALGTAKSARLSVGMTKKSNEELKQLTTVTVNGAMAELAGAQGVAGAYSELVSDHDNAKAAELAEHLVKRGENLRTEDTGHLLAMARPLSIDQGNTLPQPSISANTVKLKLEMLRQEDGDYDPEAIETLYQDIEKRYKDDPGKQLEACEALYIALDEAGHEAPEALANALGATGLESKVPALLEAETLENLEKANGAGAHSELADQLYLTQKACLTSDALADEDWKTSGLASTYDLLQQSEQAEKLLKQERLQSDDEQATRCLLQSIDSKKSLLRQCTDNLDLRVKRLTPENQKKLEKKIKEAEQQLGSSYSSEDTSKLEFAAVVDQALELKMQRLMAWEDPDSEDIAKEGRG